MVKLINTQPTTQPINIVAWESNGQHPSYNAELINRPRVEWPTQYEEVGGTSLRSSTINSRSCRNPKQRTIRLRLVRPNQR